MVVRDFSLDFQDAIKVESSEVASDEDSDFDPGPLFGQLGYVELDIEIFEIDLYGLVTINSNKNVRNFFITDYAIIPGSDSDPLELILLSANQTKSTYRDTQLQLEFQYPEYVSMYNDPDLLVVTVNDFQLTKKMPK